MTKLEELVLEWQEATRDNCEADWEEAPRTEKRLREATAALMAYKVPTS